jgi:pyridoxine 4-dehydrogenase
MRMNLLGWLVLAGPTHYDSTLLIPGTSDPGHLAENIAAGSLRLPAASVTALDRLAERGVRHHI